MRRQRSAHHTLPTPTPSSAAPQKKNVISLLENDSDGDDENAIDLVSSSSSDNLEDGVVEIFSRTKTNPKLSPVPKSLLTNCFTRIYLNTQKSSDSSTGWIIHSKIPSHLKIADRERGFVHLLKNRCPKEHGQVQIMGKMVQVPRFQKAYLADYRFTGSVHRADDESDPLDPVCVELMDWCNAQLHHRFPLQSVTNATTSSTTTATNCCVVGRLPSDEDFKSVKSEKRTEKSEYLFNSALCNWYLNGEHYVGPHADDESCMHELSPVFSLSLGQTRTFRIRDKFTNEVVKDMELRHCDFVVMGGAMQRFYKYEIVKVAGNKGKMLFGPRVNVTFRCFVNPVTSKPNK